MTQLLLGDAVPLAHAFVDRVARDLGVRVMFIKGAAAVEQGLRSPQVSVDVDALVDPARLHVLREGLSRLGWVDDNPYSTPTAATYSRTHRHVDWPCELDLHTTFPGLCAPEQGTFDLMWSRHARVEIAACELPCPDRQAHALILALNSLREPAHQGKAHQLDDLVERVGQSFDQEELRGLGHLAREMGAADTTAPFLAALGSPNPGLGSTAHADLQAWRLRTQPAWRTATWLEGLSHQPWHRLPAYVWNAVFLSEAELRIADPHMGPGHVPVLRARLRRLRRGVSALPEALRSLTAVRTPPDSGGGSPAPVEVRATWHARRVPRSLVSLAPYALGALDRMTVRKQGAVIRTFPDFDDQGIETARALHRAGIHPLTWLVKGGEPSQATAARLPSGIRLVDANSAPGVLAYLRARVVVHTHGVYGIPHRSRRKLFVNLWHGWGTKPLQARPPVAVRQSDLVTVTAEQYVGRVSADWGVPPENVIVTGLPRNDALIRSAEEARPDCLTRLVEDARVVVWMPTYRQSVAGELRADGHEHGNDFQLPGTTREMVGEMAARLGVHLIVKTHPMARSHALGDSPSLSVWDEALLGRSGLTLYQLLGQADILVTDFSSVWVDYLLLDRPIVFATADAEKYQSTRGFYSSDLLSRLPGPVARDLPGLEAEIRAAVTEDVWGLRRRELRGQHHAHLDAGSADRVVGQVRQRLDPRTRT